jgi:hypothetical protein
VVVTPEVLGQRVHKAVVGLSNLTAVKHSDTDAAILVQRAARRDQKGVILPPIRFGFLPRKPWSVLVVDSHVGVCMELRAVGDSNGRRQLPPAVAPSQDVITVLLVAIPDDSGATLAIDRNRRRPIIGCAFADLDRNRPLVAFEGAEKGVRLAVAESLPDGISARPACRCFHEDIRSFSIGEAHGR